MILMNLEHEPRALEQARFTTDEIHLEIIEGQGEMNRISQEQQVELFDTGALRTEKGAMYRRF